jgi:hypothetical protein
MIPQPKTVLIAHESFPDGVVINEADFDADTHTLWESPSKTLKLPDAKASKTAAPGA